MIEANQLTKRFGGITALDQISFQIQSGSIFGLVGSNGAGKSTFLRTLAGASLWMEKYRLRTRR